MKKRDRLTQRAVNGALDVLFGTIILKLAQAPTPIAVASVACLVVFIGLLEGRHQKKK